MIIVSYGAGTNSTAMLCGMWENGIIPDLILFADTGAERPETYKHLKSVSKWCIDNGFPEMITVMTIKKDGSLNPLYELCIEKKMLPSIAYGFKGCSLKHKRAPQDKYVNNWPPAKEFWKSGKKIIKYIGYDADEERRAHIQEDDKYIYQYPLIEWGWGREECIEAIKRMSISQPGKSACYFCPSSKPREILQLKREHPDLLERALKMEENAELTHVKGLGRSYSWAELVKFDDDQADMFGYPDIPCDCYDG